MPRFKELGTTWPPRATPANPGRTVVVHRQTWGAIAIAPQDPSAIWAGDGLHWGGKFYLHKSQDAGETWTSINFLTIGPSSSKSKVSEILTKSGDPSSVLVGVDFGISSSGKVLGEGALARTLDGGATWDRLDIPTTALAVDPNNSGVVYTGKRRSGQVYRLTDVWANWTNTEITPAAGIGDVRDIAVDSDSNVYVAASDGLWSWNGTQWTR